MFFVSQRINFTKKSGFTLAEVLVTLMVIGIIATITIPTLLQTTNERELKTAWKKTFSDLSQAYKLITQDNSGSFQALCSNDDQICLRDKFAAHLNVIKTCTTAQLPGNCWHNKDLNVFDQVLSDNSGLVLNNGTYISLDMDSKHCTVILDGMLYCGKIVVDVNGAKGPNIEGKDIFGAYILKNSIIPVGKPGSDYSCTNGIGIGCSANALIE